MRTDIETQLAALPALNAVDPPGYSRPCKICSAPAAAFDVVDFNKFCDEEDYYRYGLAGICVYYWRCATCGFLFTDFFDDWSAADFSRFIYNADYIKVDPEYAIERPTQFADNFARWLHGCEAARILDYGAGAGVFVKGMQARGYPRIEGFDPFSHPRRPHGRFDIITCFEVIEHAVDPLATFRDMLSLLADDGCIVLTQTVQPPDLLARRGTWWYLGPRNGHVSTYGDETLALIASQLGLTLHRGSTVYGLVRGNPSPPAAHAAAIVGPAFASLRLLAPRFRGDAAITFPSADSVWWHPLDGSGSRRWTGPAAPLWRAEWPPVSVLRVRVPVVGEAWRGCAAASRIALDDTDGDTRLDRGELVADFDVAGRLGGVVRLHPAAAPAEATPAADDRRRRLAITLEPPPAAAEG